MRSRKGEVEHGGPDEGRGSSATPAAEYLKDLEADEKEGLSPDIVEKWKQATLDLTEDIMKYVGQLGVNPASGPDDILRPLRRAIGEIAMLSEAVTTGVQEPDEEELRGLAKKLGAAKKELMPGAGTWW